MTAKIIDRDRAQEKVEPYLPRAGERVRIVECFDEPVAAGRVVTVKLATPSDRGHGMRLEYVNKFDDVSVRYCRVEPVEKDSKPGRAGSGVENVGSERGGSGTGQAAGEKRSDSSTRLPADPAASSGFQAMTPRQVHVASVAVYCEFCGAPAGQHCYEERGKVLTINNGSHQLRIDRFEATRERAPEKPRKAFLRCGFTPYHGGPRCESEVMGTKSGYCGDHATLSDTRDMLPADWFDKRDALRSDLDRPIPRALTTWPGAWSSATGESDH